MMTTLLESTSRQLILMLALLPRMKKLLLPPKVNLMSMDPALLRSRQLLNFFGDATLSYTVRNTEATPQTSNAALITVTVTAVDDIPTISSIVDQTIDEDTPTSVLGFTVGDVETALVSLTVSQASDNTALIPVANIVLQSLGGADWTVQVTPLLNQNGEANITLTVDDGAETANISFKVTVTPVNDVPSFTKGTDLTNLEDAGAQSIPGWASGIDDGDPELVQILAFEVTNDNSSLFSTQPSITEDGDLTFTPAANANGTALITVVLRDDGSGVAPNVNTSSIQTFNINVTEVNDAPVFTKGSDLSVAENASEQTILGWATLSDNDELVQILAFNVSNDNNGLFSVQPSITEDGDLTYTPAASTNGVATVTVTLSDDGSIILPNVNTSAQQTFTITVNENSAPTIASIEDQSIIENSQTGPLSFIVGDLETPAASLTLTRVSSNIALVTTDNVVLGGMGSLRNVNVIPTLNENGMTTITLTVSDGDKTAQTAFQVMVTAPG